MIAWWRRRKHNLTWKRVDKDIRRVIVLLTFLDLAGKGWSRIDNNEHHSDKVLRGWEEEMWQILVNLEHALSNSWSEDG